MTREYALFGNQLQKKLRIFLTGGACVGTLRTLYVYATAPRADTHQRCSVRSYSIHRVRKTESTDARNIFGKIFFFIIFGKDRPEKSTVVKYQEIFCTYVTISLGSADVIMTPSKIPF